MTLLQATQWRYYLDLSQYFNDRFSDFDFDDYSEDIAEVISVDGKIHATTTLLEAIIDANEYGFALVGDNDTGEIEIRTRDGWTVGDIVFRHEDFRHEEREDYNKQNATF